MKFLVKDTPILKNNITYGIGEIFPYSDKDKKLLWNLTEVKEETPKEKAPKKKVAPKVTAKQPTTKKKVARKKKTNSKK